VSVRLTLGVKLPFRFASHQIGCKREEPDREIIVDPMTYWHQYPPIGYQSPGMDCGRVPTVEQPELAIGIHLKQSPGFPSDGLHTQKSLELHNARSSCRRVHHPIVPPSPTDDIYERDSPTFIHEIPR